MVFSSTVFVFLFLPVVLGLYACVRRELRNLLLLLASLLFYAWGEGFFVLIMLASIVLNYGLGLWIDQVRESRLARLVAALAVIINIGLLGCYKYANFLVDNLNVFLGVIGVPAIKLASVHLPIGISFFTFQALSYVIDVYRRESPVQKNPTHLALYVAFFPQLIAGPIVRYTDIAAQLAERTVTLDGFALGVRRFIIGLGKKVLVANSVAVAADQIFAIPPSQLTLHLAWLGIVCYTLQIYFDFSGYSDMAIGMGHMFGFHFLENFNYPYISQSLKDFWRRWHISLSTWFRDYLYISLGGNRCAPLRVYVNLVIVFFLCGLWHGASWTFVIWGLFHGVFLVGERLGLEKWLASSPAPLRHGYVMGVVMVGWVVFRADTLSHALSFLAAMGGFGRGDGIEYHAGLYLDTRLALALVVGVVGALPLLPLITSAWQRATASDTSPVALVVDSVLTVGSTVGLGFIFLGSAMALLAGTHNPFIYFRF